MGEEQIHGLVELALNKWTLLMAGGVFFAVRILNGLTFLSKRAWYRRILPFLPDALGCGAAISGGIPVVADQPLILQLAAGLWCGYLAQRFHKVLGQTVLGDDKVISTKLLTSTEDDKEGEET